MSLWKETMLTNFKQEPSFETSVQSIFLLNLLSCEIRDAGLTFT